MRTLNVRSFVIPVFAALTLASSLAAQDKPSALLSAPEVSQLISRAQPADLKPKPGIGGHLARGCGVPPHVGGRRCD
jgi:hypothetical protein